MRFNQNTTPMIPDGSRRRPPDRRDRLLHQSFEAAIMLKGIHAIFEIVAGVLLIPLSPEFLNRVIVWFIRQEMEGHRHDVIVQYLTRLSDVFTAGTRHFAIFYLLSHGVIKLFLVLLLWRRKLWAYPLTIVSLVLFIAYQLYRFTFTHSAWLMALTVLDAALIYLTWREYGRMKGVPSGGPSGEPGP
jgi:uncharacterized membrane protein